MTGGVSITAGDVAEVQLSAEAEAMPAPSRKKAQRKPRSRDKKKARTGAARASSRLHVTVREADGKEHRLDIEGARIGLRTGQRGAAAHGRARGMREPMLLVLSNLSTGESEPYEPAIATYLRAAPSAGPHLTALVLSLISAALMFVATLTVIAPGAKLFSAAMYALGVGALLFPLFLWITQGLRRLGAKGRYLKAREKLIADIDSRMRAYAPAQR